MKAQLLQTLEAQPEGKIVSQVWLETLAVNGKPILQPFANVSRLTFINKRGKGWLYDKYSSGPSHTPFEARNIQAIVDSLNFGGPNA